MSNGLYLEAQSILHQIIERFEERFSLKVLPEPLLIGPVLASQLFMEEIKTKATSNAFATDSDPFPPEHTHPPPKDATNFIITEHAAATSESITEEIVAASTTTTTTTTTKNTTTTKTSAPVKQFLALTLTRLEKNMNWICVLSEQYFVIKAFARVLQIHADKLDLPLSVVTREKLHRLFKSGTVEGSKWMNEVMALQTRLTLTRSSTEGNVGEVLQELEALSI
ncbi:hypothetical protein TWF788_006389 [Orbilia oligospora]|uniref:Uncharacterized protein n=1 Tax=Orbilia oligospora TaxID=2813651 RepID=A0A7C8PWH1_ORBOL|nr:hypothetical protein TWF788_006389 [Orbilia oligospora]